MDHQGINKLDGIEQYTQKLGAQQTQILYSKDFKMPIKFKSSNSITVYPAYNNTFVVHSWNLFHISHEGNILKQLTITKSQNIWGKYMFTNKICGIWIKNQQSKQHQLRQWNLQTNQLLSFKINSLSKQQLLFLLIFSQTKQLCIIQSAIQANEDYKLKISYYKYPLNTQQDKPTHQYNFIIKQLNKFKSPTKLNNHSGIVWRSQNYVIDSDTIYIFDLKDQSRQIRTYVIDHIFNKDKDILQARLQNIWEPKYGYIYAKYNLKISYYLFTKKYPNVEPNQQQLSKEGIQQIIWEYKQNNYKIPKYAKRQQHGIQFITGFRKIQRFISLQKIFYASPMMYPPPKYNRLPIYYVDFQTQQIIGNQPLISGKYSSAQIKKRGFEYLQYNNNMYLQHRMVQIEGQQPELRISLTKIKQIIQKIQTVVTFFMCAINQEFDQDLIYLVTDLMDQESENEGFQPKLSQFFIQNINNPK